MIKKYVQVTEWVSTSKMIIFLVIEIKAIGMMINLNLHHLHPQTHQQNHEQAYIFAHKCLNSFYEACPFTLKLKQESFDRKNESYHPKFPSFSIYSQFPLKISDKIVKNNQHIRKFGRLWLFITRFRYFGISNINSGDLPKFREIWQHWLRKLRRAIIIQENH